jgi:hypothetical protein
MYLCVKVSILTLRAILISDFGIIPTVWYLLFFILTVIIHYAPLHLTELD